MMPPPNEKTTIQKLMADFEPGKFFKRIAWIVVAISYGITTQLDAIGGVENIEWERGAILALVYGIVRASLGWWNANRPSWAIGKGWL